MYKDHVQALPSIVVAAADPDGVRKTSKVENLHRTEKILARITGQVDITVAGTGVRNRGSILAAFTESGFTSNGRDKVLAELRAQRFIADYFSSGQLPATRLAGAGVQAATQLSEVVPLWLCFPRTVAPGESKYVESIKNALLEVFFNPTRAIGRLVAGGVTGTITNLAISLEQVFDLEFTAPSLFSRFTRQIVTNVVAANSGLVIDLRDQRAIRGVLIMQESDEGEVNDIINSVILRGDNNAVIGPKATPWNDLVDNQFEDAGPVVVGNRAYYYYDFVRYGRMSTRYEPGQDSNLRLELNVQPSVTGVGTGSKVRVVLDLVEPSEVPVMPPAKHA